MRVFRSALTVAVLALCSAQASAQSTSALPINLTGASVTALGSDKIRSNRVEASGSRYDVDLQWNPFDLRFDIASVAQHETTQ